MNTKNNFKQKQGTTIMNDTKQEIDKEIEKAISYQVNKHVLDDNFMQHQGHRLDLKINRIIDEAMAISPEILYPYLAFDTQYVMNLSFFHERNHVSIKELIIYRIQARFFSFALHTYQTKIAKYYPKDEEVK